MENASKALLIAAGVLVVILIISFGIMIYNNSNATSKQAKQLGNVMSTVAGETINKITIAGKDVENSLKTYNLSVSCDRMYFGRK